MPKGYRKPRLEREMLRQLGEAVAHQMKDPRVGWVTVTRVELSNDLSVAKVFVSQLGGPQDRDRALNALNGARGFFQSILRRGLSMRQIPELRFLFDKGMENVHRVGEILRSLKRESRSEEE
jgi:ribosome-binding factor A